MNHEPLAETGNLRSSDSKDAASVGSHQTGATQTRFSFYNAQDFVQQTTPDALKATPLSPAGTPKPRSSKDRDSEEILRSLQEHEQQRLEILGGGATKQDGDKDTQPPNNHKRVASATTTNHTGSKNDSSSATTASSSALLRGTHSDLAVAPNAAGASSDASNPYEDAIKEALDLLRKHRSSNTTTATTTGSQASTPAVSNVLHTPPRPSTTKQSQSASSSPWAAEPYTVTRTPPDSDRILQARHTEAFFPNTENQQDAAASGDATTPSAVALGEAYQAEIEARRKQRQERMARYATRLAELKQEDKSSTSNPQPNTPSFQQPQPEPPHHWNGSSNSDVGQPASWGGGGAAASQHLDALAASWNHANGGTTVTGGQPTSRSVPSTFAAHNNVPMGVTTGGPGSVSSISKEDDVQRGVERVLLAILERAHSQGRGGRDVPPVPEDASAVLVPPKHSSPSTVEEKKGVHPEEEEVDEEVDDSAVDHSTNDNAIVRAMSDLLGATSTSTLGSSSPNRNAMETFLVPNDGSNQPPQSLSSADHPDESSVPSKGHRKTNLTVDTSFQDRSTESQSLPSDSIDPPPPDDEDEEEEDDLDKMVRTVLNQQQQQKDHAAAAERKPLPKKDDSFDRRVRKVLSPEPPEVSSSSDPEKEPAVEAVAEGDEESTATSHDDEEADDDAFSEEGREEDAEEEDDDNANEVGEDDYGDGHRNDRSELDGVLGPLGAGGTTGVVLEADSSASRDSPSRDSPSRDSVQSPSILDSLSAAVSMVAGTLTSEKSPTETDKYATSDAEDNETNELMRTLCAHLLPTAGKEQSTRLLDKRPDWDETNPDEAGYRIIRLTTMQLIAVEDAYKRAMEADKRRKQEAKDDDGNDEAFEHDLKTAESILEEHERSQENGKTNLDEEIEARARIYPEQVPLEGFPGIKSTGRGEMGDLEYFHLPIIFKSHVTGFEPTKDLVLESGNVMAGQYLVEGELGSAAFSTAYRCVDLNSEGDGPDGHEEVCLKVIKNTKDFFDQSLDEIKILELLRQTGMCQEKNLVEMRTFFYHREHLVIVTELLRQNLFEFGKFIIDSDEEPYFTMTRLCYLTRQILIALDFVHRLGLVHSDVKPENILLSSYSRAQVKLIDFGSSCFLTDRQSSYIQSRSYRAPEVILGLPYDGRIDVWSLGCVVAEMFTGEVTFQNDSIVSMLSRIEAICGTFPLHMIAQGRQSGRFFTKCGLLFEKLPSEDQSSSHSEDSDEDDDTSSDRRKRYVDVFQPKVTTLSARMGFASDLMQRYDNQTKLSKEENRQALFVDFVRQLLTIDPEKRPTAAQALKHPWMKYAEDLTEEEIKYPSF